MKKALCLLLIGAMLPFCGCSQRIELAFVAVCLGVDAREDGVTLTVKCPDYTGDKQDGEQSGYTTLSVKGADWPRAVAALYAAAPVTPQFSQLREIIIGEGSFLYMPPERLFACVDQLPGLRVHALVTVCPGSAAGQVESLNPEIGKRLSKYLDISLKHYEQQGVLPATSLSGALRDLGGCWRDPVLAYSGGGEARGYAIGSLGTLLLTPEEVQLYRLIRGESQSYMLASDGRFYGTASRGRARRSVAGNTLILELPVYITYSLYDEPPGPGAALKLQEEIQAFLHRLQSVGCDALGFGCAAVQGFSTLPEWLASGWPQRYAGADIQVVVEGKARQQPLL